MGWADPSSTGSAAPSSTVAVVWMAAPSMVVESTRDWMKGQLLVEVELL